MSINNISPPPIDNDPPPSSEEGKKKLQQFISKSTWGAFKTWLSLQVTAALNQLLTAITFDGNKGLGSINGLPATPGMAQLMGSGQFGTITGGRIAGVSYNPAPVAQSGSFTISSSSGNYYQVGHLVQIQVVVQINIVTTAGNLAFSLPPGLPISGSAMMAAGDFSNAITLTAYTLSATSMQLFKYDATASVTTSGHLIVIYGTYYTP